MNFDDPSAHVFPISAHVHIHMDVCTLFPMLCLYVVRYICLAVRVTHYSHHIEMDICDRRDSSIDGNQ